MKLNISDLLDDYREDALIPEESTPLSMERIQMRTMGVVFPEKRHLGRRAVPRLLVAVLILCALAVSAIAEERTLSVSDWFRTALRINAETDVMLAEYQGADKPWRSTLSEKQLAAIDAHGKFIYQSQTKNGSTITLVALYGDEYVLHLYLQVEAPEGTVLPDGVEYIFGDRHHLPSGNSIVEVPPGYTRSHLYRPDMAVMPDADPTDNKKDFVITLDHCPYPQRLNGILQKQWTFHDDVPKNYFIPGIFFEMEDGTYEQVVSGAFSFDITNTHSVERTDIDLSGCQNACLVNWGDEENHYSYTIDPIQISLSPFSAEIKNRFTCTDEHNIPHMKFQIIMKDGTTEMHWDVGRLIDTDGYSHIVKMFTNPIDISEIDYILIGDPYFGDGLHKVYPET